MCVLINDVTKETDDSRHFSMGAVFGDFCFTVTSTLTVSYGFTVMPLFQIKQTNHKRRNSSTTNVIIIICVINITYLNSNMFDVFVFIQIDQYRLCLSISAINLYPAFVQFEQSKSIDWLNVCYLRSLTKI
jgi:hypothetical protein